MDFEVDRLEFLGGLRHGRTLGSPLSVLIHNTEWPKWVDAMDPEARDDLDAIRETGRGAALTRPRPGHADLVGGAEVRLRRRPGRAGARLRAGDRGTGRHRHGVQALLATAGITVISHVVEIGGERLPDDAPRPGPDELDDIDASPGPHAGRRTRSSG
jgi:chorismate synthase